MWVPSHVGLAGNSSVDNAAKAVLLLPVADLIVPYSDHSYLLRHLNNGKQWQIRWISETEIKLHAIELRVNVINLFGLHHRDEIIFNS